MAKPAFTQRDVEKAIAAVQARGLRVGRVEVHRDCGRIVILPADALTAQGEDLDGELRSWREERGDG